MITNMHTWNPTLPHYGTNKHSSLKSHNTQHPFCHLFFRGQLSSNLLIYGPLASPPCLVYEKKTPPCITLLGVLFKNYFASPNPHPIIFMCSHFIVSFIWMNCLVYNFSFESLWHMLAACFVSNFSSLFIYHEFTRENGVFKFCI